MWGKADKNKIEITKKIDFPQSLGSFYETITSFLGFTPDSDEWKVMGMAAYGDKNIYLKKLQQLIKLKKVVSMKLTYHILITLTLKAQDILIINLLNCLEIYL